MRPAVHDPCTPVTLMSAPLAAIADFPRTLALATLKIIDDISGTTVNEWFLNFNQYVRKVKILSFSPRAPSSGPSRL